MRTGRPPLYRPELNEQAFRLCLLGATNEDLARSFHVITRTIELWIQKHPDFRRAVKAGREEADARVSDSLYKRATGYTRKVIDKEKDPSSGELRDVEREEYHKPDVVACIFWLKNRRPDLWRDTQDRVLKGDPNAPIAIIEGQAALDDLRRRVEQTAAASTSTGEARQSDD